MTLILLLPAFVHAKTIVSVPRFEDKTEKGRCPELTGKQRADLDHQLQSKLIAGLLELKRFQIQEREVRKMSPEHSIVGTVRAFEVCATQGRGQKVQIALEVQLISSKEGLTHMFSSRAETFSVAGRAPQLAMNSAILEIIKRIDNTVPRRGAAVRLKSKQAATSTNPIQLRLIPRNQLLAR
jgi:hypothetical protein